MTISRRQLYAAGETFGESATRREPGRVVCGGGDSSSSNATHNYDKRNAVQNGVGVSGDGNVLNITDGGSVKAALTAVTATNARAFDSIDRTNALSGEGFEKLLQAADKLWQRGETLIGQTQQHVADAYLSANTDAQGTIDNKTIVVLGVAAAAVAGLVAYSRK